MQITLYHNPKCGKSCETLAIIRDAGIEPTIIEYLANPLSRHELQELAKQLHCPISELMRVNDTLYTELNLGHVHCNEVERLDALIQHPELYNRPIACSELGARICRPPEIVLKILPIINAYKYLCLTSNTIQVELLFYKKYLHMTNTSKV